ncbi:MAG: hypothetical protein DWQ02_24210 [Bacteroidetes bacterium]|nr:MAG: hypothetical protein DWQ02_24210 [Bacteroidota bacterium]
MAFGIASIYKSHEMAECDIFLTTFFSNAPNKTSEVLETSEILRSSQKKFFEKSWLFYVTFKVLVAFIYVSRIFHKYLENGKKGALYRNY